MSTLILVRHGLSEWNAKSLWTGLTDVELAEEGRAEARRAAEAIRDIPVNVVFVSALKRAQQTYESMNEVLGITDVTPIVAPELNERDYGIYTGKNKWQVCEEVGEAQFQCIRRGWDDEIPGGESLKAVYDRAVPYFEQHIKPELVNGRNVLVVSHGNTLRALEKYLDHIDDKMICELEIPTGQVHCYTIGADGAVENKEIKLTTGGVAA